MYVVIKIFMVYNFRMDALLETEVDPLLDDGDHPLSGRDNGLMGDNFICSTCGDESPDLKTHQIHAEICHQVKADKFRSPLSIQELVNLRIKIDANRSDEASPPSQSRSTQVISKRTPFQGKKLFPCYKCGKEFERAGQLIAHEMKHTEEAERKRNDKIEKATATISIKDKQKVEKATLAKLQPFHCPSVSGSFQMPQSVKNTSQLILELFNAPSVQKTWSVSLTWTDIFSVILRKNLSNVQSVQKGSMRDPLSNCMCSQFMTTKDLFSASIVQRHLHRK